MSSPLKSLTSALSGDTARFAPGKILPAALTIISTPIFARTLGADEYGVLAVASTATLLSAAVIFGWSEIVAVRVAVDPTQKLEHLASEATAFLAFAGIGGLVATVAFAVYGGDYLLVAAVATATVAWGSVTFYTGAMRGRGDAAGYIRTSSLGTAGRAVLGVPAALAGFGPVGIIFGWAIGAFFAAGLAARRLNFKVSSVRGQLPSKRFLAFALPAAVVTSSFLALSLCDRLLISIFRSNAEVGTYALGYSIVEQSMVLGFAIFQASGLPKLLEVFEREGYELGATELAKYMTVAMTVVGAIALPIALFGPELLRVVGGAEFAIHADGFMPFVVIGVLFLGVGQYLSIPLQHAGDSRSWAKSLVISFVIHIGLNLVLIPPFGLIGAGVATAVGYLAFLVLSAHEATRVGVRPLAQLRPKCCILGSIAGGTVGAASLALDVWPVGVLAVPLAYISVVYLFRQDIDWKVL